MTDRFQRWFDWLITKEGSSYENDPDDSGGETKFGIDKESHPDVDIRNLTRDRARQIYWTEYWNAVHAEELPVGVGEVVADIGVNNGKDRAARWLQQAVCVTVDGKIGRNTLQGAAEANKHELIDTLLCRRDRFYRSIARGSQAKYLKGWLSRNASLRQLVA